MWAQSIGELEPRFLYSRWEHQLATGIDRDHLAKIFPDIPGGISPCFRLDLGLAAPAGDVIGVASGNILNQRASVPRRHLYKAKNRNFCRTFFA